MEGDGIGPEIIDSSLDVVNLVKKKYVWAEITKTSLNIQKWVLSDFNKKYLKGFMGFNANTKRPLLKEF